MNRRDFIKSSSLVLSGGLLSSVDRAVPALRADKREVIFEPHPHSWMPSLDWAYLTDENEDPFFSEVGIRREGIVIADNLRSRRFSINVRWYVDGFGYIQLSADNAGYLYSRDDFNKKQRFNLNFEFARSRVKRNTMVKQKYERKKTRFSTEVNYLFDLSNELFESAQKNINNVSRLVKYSNAALKYALITGEKIELEHARSQIRHSNRIKEVFFGCETRQYIWAKSEPFVERFSELFNYATVTHYVWDSWYELFEPREGVYKWGIKDNIVDWLQEKEITIEGRPLFWFHPVVTPNWLKEKNMSELKGYIETHTKNLIGHYGDKIKHWEVFNEYHDWANIHHHTPEQITELVRLACDKVKEINPSINRILNNCCPWAEYAAWGRFAKEKEPAGRPQRSPRKFIEDLHQAGVEYDVLGIQIYFPRRDLSDIVRLLERMESFRKPIYITEIGTTSGPDTKSVASGEFNLPTGPYEWHRYWDEQLQADWLEQVYTIFYSRPSIKAINWYDFSDFRPFIKNGGLITESSEAKPAFYRLKNLLDSWNRWPKSS